MRNLCLGTPHRCTLSEREATACWELGLPPLPSDGRCSSRPYTRPMCPSILWPQVDGKIEPQRIPAPTWQMLRTVSKSCPRWNVPTRNNLDHDHFSASFPCLTTWTNSHLKTCPELLEGTRSPPPFWFWTLVEFWSPPQADLLWDFKRSVCVWVGGLAGHNCCCCCLF